MLYEVITPSPSGTIGMKHLRIASFFFLTQQDATEHQRAGTPLPQRKAFSQNYVAQQNGKDRNQINKGRCPTGRYRNNFV